MPGSDEFDDLERVVTVGDDLVALGLRGDAFGVWRRDDDGWRMGQTFGSLPDEARSSPFVSSLVTGESGQWATTSDGVSYAAWHSPDGDTWTPVELPSSSVETAGERIVTVAADDDVVLLVADNGLGGGL